MSKFLAKSLLGYIAISAESLATEVEQTGELTQDNMAVYDTIHEAVGEVVAMKPLDDIESVGEVVQELGKVSEVNGEVVAGADPEETSGEVVVGDLEDHYEDEDAEDEAVAQVIAASGVAAMESLVADVIDAGVASDYMVKRYNAIGKVYFNDSKSQPVVEQPETLLAAVESFKAVVQNDLNVTSASLEDLLG